MSESTNGQHATEVIDTASLPNWNNPEGVHDCGDPACVNGMIALNLDDEDDFKKASSIVEDYVMGTMFTARELPSEGLAASGLVQDLVSYLLAVPHRVVIDVLLEISDAAAGLFVAQKEAGGTNEPMA